MRDPNAKLLFSVPPTWSENAVVPQNVSLQPTVLLANTSISNSFLQSHGKITCFVDLLGSDQTSEDVSKPHRRVITDLQCYKVDCFLAHGDVLEHENASLSASDTKDIVKSMA